MQKLDLTGQTFGMLTVTSESVTPGQWQCRCKCGKQVYVRGASLRSGNTKSCGCLKHKSGVRRVRTPHGKKRTVPFIDFGTFTLRHEEWIVEFIKVAREYGVTFNRSTLMYTTSHNGRMFGPFDNVVQMFGHMMFYCVGDVNHRTHVKVQRVRDERNSKLGRTGI